jgi:hypothetical protein
MQMHAGFAMRDSDHPEVDGLIAAFFGAFDNRHGRIPDAGALARLFAETAVVAMHSSGTCTLFTPEEFIAPRIALLGSGELVDFHEWEESQETRIIGSLGLRSSRYAKAGFRDGAAIAGTGTKFFQLARVCDDWKIVALSWVDDA